MIANALQDLSIIGDYRALLGESPVWCFRSQSLIWVDILQRRLLRYWPQQGKKIEIHELPFLCSAALLTEESEQFLLVTAQGVMLYDYSQQSHRQLCPWPEDEQTRPNEAAIAPDGSLWFSTMDVTARSPIGSWYRYEYDGAQPEKMLSDQHVPNTLAWLGSYVWFVDTFRHRFCRSAAHRISTQTLSEWPIEDLLADGSALTLDGMLLNACWGSACLTAYRLDAAAPQWLTTHPLPVTQPTSCAFGGPDLHDLYITSASDGLAMPSKTEGALLRYRTPYTGQQATLFNLKK
ncbi:SMP-30/gluconolactonase/LRE family protein [Hafnia paralvei]|nr:SMP-30/gluconolactonase/LRE family protein [Hafnia paralvei]MCE9919813.1 SMP-30/gluconolactonase/LRE family protein [Hafnia paralvei]TBL63864.1 SMP-30/gluconolactonase/LRE family protein [Hafnia paralvei]